MIIPMIHRMLRREDLLGLVAQIATTDPTRAPSAADALESGKIDALLDSPVALDAIRGRGGAPAPLPLTLLWYVPVRAALKDRGESDIDLADYTASLPLVFLPAQSNHQRSAAGGGLDSWINSIESLPEDTVVRGERAAYCGALALWWAGLFPRWVARRGRGQSMIRAYVDFSGNALRMASRNLGRNAPRAAGLYGAAAERVHVLRDALHEVSRDYLGSEAHTVSGRLDRYLARLGPSETAPDSGLS